MTEELRSQPIDLGVIGIGENGHIAFNDPPADFDTREAYILVNLSDTCKQQQVHEGWFATLNDVPKQAVSMTVYQIMQCERIISCVPYAAKADAVQKTLYNDATNMVPATVMKDHKDFTPVCGCRFLLEGGQGSHQTRTRNGRLHAGNQLRVKSFSLSTRGSFRVPIGSSACPGPL